MLNWASYPNFTAAEFRCKHTGREGMSPQYMARLQRLRTDYGKPMIISSGYRHETHPIEANKDEPGPHSTGRACDVAVLGGDALALMALAVKHGFTGVGVNQKGGGRYLHLDDLPHEDHRPRPWLWSY